MSRPGTYALYKGDRLLGVGTKRELAERLGVKPETVGWYATPTCERRNESGNRLVAVRVDDA
ncbi:MAG: hypothetical protein IKG21_12900 [Atopobiaceae bacterium]|nr:hypothetical protein [Atopobiaceae bacterium]